MVVSQVASESVSMESLAYQKAARQMMLLKQKSVRLNRAVSLDNDLEMTLNDICQSVWNMVRMEFLVNLRLKLHQIP